MFNRNKIRHKLEGIKKRADKKYFDYDLTVDWYIKELERGTCAITGIPFNLEPWTGRMHPFLPAVDREDNNKGYTQDNCNLVVYIFNIAKGENTYEEMYEWSKEYVRRNK